MFGIAFVGQSFPIDAASFEQIGPANWRLDATACVNPNHDVLKEACLFLTTPGGLPADAALGLYVSVGGEDWQYRGSVSNQRPSDVFPLKWPCGTEAARSQGQIRNALVGVSIERLADLAMKEGERLGAKENFAKMVAMDLFRYLESFNAGTRAGPDTLVVPANFLDRWFEKFARKFRLDPDFLTRDANKHA